MPTTSIVRVPGDYLVIAKNGGIVFDLTSTSTIVSANTGTVTIYGDLNVIGSTTYVATTNTNITDNLIYLNAGETNTYVTKGRAGIAIDRGFGVNTTTGIASIIFDDTRTWAYDNVALYRGVWELDAATTSLGKFGSALQLNAIRVDPSLNFLNIFGKENPTAVMNVRGTLNYEQRVLDDDDIPNKKYVDDRASVSNELARKLQVGNTYVEINDSDVVPSDPYFNVIRSISAYLGTNTNRVFRLEGISAQVQGLLINDTNIQVLAGRSSNDLQLTPVGTGTVIVNAGLGLRHTGDVYEEPNMTHIYSTSTVGGGGTGVYFTAINRSDEFVSRKRAIIYGIIF